MEFKMITTKKNPNCIVITAQLCLLSRWRLMLMKAIPTRYLWSLIPFPRATHWRKFEHSRLCPHAHMSGTRESMFARITPWRSQLDGKCSVKIHSDASYMNVFAGSHCMSWRWKAVPSTGVEERFLCFLLAGYLSPFQPAGFSGTNFAVLWVALVISQSAKVTLLAWKWSQSTATMASWLEWKVWLNFTQLFEQCREAPVLSTPEMRMGQTSHWRCAASEN